MKKQDAHWKLSPKEFMLLAGILVALFILFTFWLNPMAEYSNIKVQSLPLPELELPSTEKILMQIAEAFNQSVR